MSKQSILSISLGRMMLDRPEIRARQAAYSEGMELIVLLVGPGEKQESQEGSVTYLAPGGASKADALRKAVFAARAVMQKTDVALVSVEDPLWTGLIGWLARLGTPVPFQLQDHSGRFARRASTLAEVLFWPISLILARSSTRVRTVSERGKRGLERHGVSAKKIDVLPVPVSVPRELPHRTRTDATIRVLSVGRLEPEKGFATLFHQWKEAALPNAELVIAGSGHQRNELEELAKTLGIADSVTFLGMLSSEKLWQEYANADLYVQHSRFEGWGRTLFEAAWAGLPIISTDVGLVGEVLLPEKELLVCGLGDEASSVRASTCLRALASDRQRRTQLGNAAHEAAARYLLTHSYEAAIQGIRNALRRAASL